MMSMPEQQKDQSTSDPDKQSNWPPASPDSFSLFLRLDWRRRGIINGSWKPQKTSVHTLETGRLQITNPKHKKQDKDQKGAFQNAKAEHIWSKQQTQHPCDLGR